MKYLWIVFSSLLVVFIMLVNGEGSQAQTNPGPPDKVQMLRGLVKESSKGVAIGRIDECQLDGNIIYSLSANAYDGGGSYMDSYGKRMKIYCGCGLACLDQSSECKRITQCVPIYKMKGNIFDQQALDTYGISE